MGMGLEDTGISYFLPASNNSCVPPPQGDNYRDGLREDRFSVQLLFPHPVMPTEGNVHEPESHPMRVLSAVGQIGPLMSHWVYEHCSRAAFQKGLALIVRGVTAKRDKPSKQFSIFMMFLSVVASQNIQTRCIP